MSDFGQCFRAFLRSKKITQVEAAERCGFSQPQISRLCNQIHQPRPHVLAHMALRLGVSERELTGVAVGVVREGGVGYQERHIGVVALDDLKRKWQRSDRDRRKVIEVDLERLFPRQANQIIRWMEDEGK